MRTIIRVAAAAVLLFAAPFPSAAREKVAVAVLDFEAKNVTDENAEAITDLFRTELFNTGCFKVVERQKIQRIVEELKFQASGVTGADQAAEIGRLLNVKKIMIGTVTLLGGTHILNTRIVDVQSGQVELAEAVESRGGEENLPKAVTELALNISYKIGLEGSVIRITGETVYIDLGAADGVKVGQTFDVFRQGETITDLEGRIIGANTETMGRVMVTRLQDRFSETAASRKTAEFRKGDRVKPAVQGEEEDDAEEQTPAPKPKPKPKPKKTDNPPPKDRTGEDDSVEMPALF